MILKTSHTNHETVIFSFWSFLSCWLATNTMYHISFVIGLCKLILHAIAERYILIDFRIRQLTCIRYLGYWTIRGVRRGPIAIWRTVESGSRFRLEGHCWRCYMACVAGAILILLRLEINNTLPKLPGVIPCVVIADFIYSTYSTVNVQMALRQKQINLLYHLCFTLELIPSQTSHSASWESLKTLSE